MPFFDATQVDPASNGGSLPVGRHKVLIISSVEEAVKNDDQSGKLVLMLQCIEGPAQGMTQKYQLNIHNKSPEASRIAYQQLSALCHVVGVLVPNTKEDLHNKPFYVDIRKQPDNDKYVEVGGVYDVNGNSPEKGKTPQAPAAQVGQQFQQAPQQQPMQQAPSQQYQQPDPNQPQPQYVPQQAPQQQYQQPVQQQYQPPAQQPQQAAPAQQQPQGWSPPQGQPQAAGPAPWTRA